jgi:hypothetical protein
MSKKLKPRTHLGLEFSRHSQHFNFVQKSVQTLDYDYGVERNDVDFHVLLLSPMNVESGYHTCVILKNNGLLRALPLTDSIPSIKSGA